MLHPQEVQDIVNRGESVIFQGRVVNKVSGAVLPTAVELAGDDVSRKQFKLDIDRQIADLKKQSDELGAAPEVEVANDILEVSDLSKSAEPEKKVVQTGRKSAE